ncbi:MAG: SpoIID/LytB domain-containing protein [Nitrospirae bacterium]|nr:SpoIID/LytB domain-containing protein [Nitrospirota bacterium]
MRARSAGKGAFLRRLRLTSWMPAVLLIVALFPLLPSAVQSSPLSAKIKVLILEENYRMPGNDEKLVLLGNTEGEFLMNGARYSGTIEVWKGEKGLYIINELPLEEYVADVVASEVGMNWDLEALKVQAVIARTYAVYRKNAASNSRFHLTSSVLHQVYKGNNTQVQIAYAVRETAGEILTYEGKPIEAFYHSTCGGKTENPEEVFGKSYPYLKSVESNCELSPYWLWERKIPKEEIEKALGLKGLKEMRILSHTSTGRAKELAVEAASGKSVVKATELRKLLGWSRLPSTNFTMKEEADAVTFTGKGYGHGVGLCQWSALQMAREGKNYREILSFFYPGTVIRVYEGN